MRPRLEDMTLREKIGQTGQPSPGALKSGVERLGSYSAYFKENPFGSFWLSESCMKPDGTPFASPAEMGEAMRQISLDIQIPLLITADYENGCDSLFPNLHPCGTNLEMGAAASRLDLIYKRAYYWARELRSCGVNNPYGPVNDLHKNFFSAGIMRKISDDWRIVAKVQEALIKGIQDAGIAACCKHYPGLADDYRDAHFSTGGKDMPMDEWYANEFNIFKSATEAGVMSIETNHHPWPSADPRYARGKVYRPCTASKPVMDILRNEVGFNGVLYTDAVNMKGMSALFDHEDVYIESFKAGHDVVIFVHDDYFDIMEKAYHDGRITMEEIDEKVTRVLDLKEKLGLFDGPLTLDPLTEEENADYDRVLTELAQTAQTLLRNEAGLIPVDPKKIKNVAIFPLCPSESFTTESVQIMKETLEERGMNVTIVPKLTSKNVKPMAEANDLIIYACQLKCTFPLGMPFYSDNQLNHLFNSLSYGAEKTVIVSFGNPTIYYNYFDGCDTFINTYSADRSAMKVVVDGIFGDFEFKGKSPVSLIPDGKVYEV